MFIETVFVDPRLAIMHFVVVIFSVCLHEYAHAWAAYRFGDDTAACRGYLTLNPVAQMGWAPLVILCFLGVAWGTTPVDRSRLRHRDHFWLVLLAGPGMNLLLAFVCVWFAVLLGPLAERHIVLQVYLDMARLAAGLNLFLLIFNLMPIPVLDGWNFVEAVFRRARGLPGDLRNGLTYILIIVLVMSPIGMGLQLLTRFATDWSERFIVSVIGS